MEEKSSKDKTIITQYAELNRFATNAAYDRALKCANKSKFFTTTIWVSKPLSHFFSTWIGSS